MQIEDLVKKLDQSRTDATKARRELYKVIRPMQLGLDRSYKHVPRVLSQIFVVYYNPAIGPEPVDAEDRIYKITLELTTNSQDKSCIISWTVYHTKRGNEYPNRKPATVLDNDIKRAIEDYFYGKIEQNARIASESNRLTKLLKDWK